MAKELAEKRAWQVALRRVRAVEAAWDDPAGRQRAILECRHWLAAQSHLPRLCRLSPLLDPAMDRRRLAAVLAPVARAGSRRRVTDVDVLDADAPAAAAPAGLPVPLTVVADCLRSAFNLGGILRTAECLGAAGVWTCGYTAEPTQPAVAQAAMGTEKLVPWRVWPSVTDALAALRAGGVQVVALETVAGAPAPGAFHWRFPCALVLGNERFGLAPETLALCDASVRIPVYGRKNSLNVAAAFAVAGYAARAAWERSGEVGEV
jgi:tRNA G18 (ribose-2'-O)-methylase SpoU